MLHRRPTRGRGFLLFGLGLVAALVWTVVIADPAFAIHKRSRAFSIVNQELEVPKAPNLFTCRLVESMGGHDYRCANKAADFQQLLMGTRSASQDAGPDALVAGDSTADDVRTKLLSPARFTCRHRAGPSRGPRDFRCTDDRGRRFTLGDFAYVHPIVNGEPDPDVTYALPCRPCVAKTGQ